MADEANSNNTASEGANSPDAGQDLIKNLKAEVNRKIEGLTKINQDLVNQMMQLQQNLTAAKVQPAKQAEEENLDDLVYNNPKAYTQKIKESVKADIASEMYAQERQNKVLGDLVKNFPELSSADHALTQKAIEIYKSYDEASKSNPASYKAAVLEAATELDIKPVTKRKKSGDSDVSYNNDDDAFSTGGGNSSSGSKKPSKGKDELDPNTAKLAELMGLNIKDPKVVESLKNKSKRSNWNKYE